MSNKNASRQVEEALQRGVEHQRAGRAKEAESLYREALAVDPKNADACHLLGLILHRQGDSKGALPFLKTAVTENSKVAHYYNSYGEALAEVDLLKDAVIAFERAVKLEPKFPLAFTNLANALHKTGRLNESVQAYRQALALKPDLLTAHNNLGNVLNDLGRSDEAIEAYHNALKLKPDFESAAYNLGAVQFRAGKIQESIDSLRRALELNPKLILAHYNLGNALKETNQLEEAAVSYRKAIELDPGHYETYATLGALLKALGRLDEGAAACRKSIELRPDCLAGHFNLGTILHQQGKREEAISSFERALDLKADYHEAYNNLGCIAFEKGLWEEAANFYAKTAEIAPNLDVAHFNLGTARKMEKKYPQAVAAFRRTIELKADHHDAYLNLAVAYKDMAEFEEAIVCCKKALELKPDFFQAHFNLGLAYYQLGRRKEAIASFRHAAALDLGHAEVLNNLGCALYEEGEYKEAIASHRRALELKPDFAEAWNNLSLSLKDLCKLDECVAASRKAIAIRPDYTDAHNALLFMLNHLEKITNEELFEEHSGWGKNFADPLMANSLPHANTPDPTRRLRIGYISPDFFQHVNSRVMEPFLANHDRTRFEIFCYSNAQRSDGTTLYLKGYADHWREIRPLTNEEAADLIRKDGIDILVELAGHTGYNRLLVLAHKPAPVQVSYLGYVNTTGMKAVDYRLTDAYGDPPGLTQKWYTEEQILMPGSCLCYAPFKVEVKVNALPSLTRGYVTFGSFNNFSKLNDRVLDLWAEVLSAVPGSRILLKARPLGEEATCKRVLSRFALRGIGPERIDLRAWTPHNHLELFNEVDIALDPFPFNGGMSTFESLWMGVPIITLEGDNFVSRMGIRHMACLGLDSWIAKTPQDYVRIAVEKASRLEEIDKLRSVLRNDLLRSPLMDAPRFTRNLETSYRQMWEKWCVHHPSAALDAKTSPSPTSSTPPEAPKTSVMSTSTLQNDVASHPFWYHRIELPGGIVTPGWAPMYKDAFRLPADLTGKRVLDVGAWDGFWTFEALKRGARQAVAIDDFSQLRQRPDFKEENNWKTFDLCRKALGYSEERCQRMTLSVYSAREDKLGRFDIILFFGTIYHLRHPLLALDRLSSICNDDLYVESAILDDYSPYRGGLGKGYPGGQVVAEFYPDDQYGSDATNWWVPTLPCLAHMTRSAGFLKAEAWKLVEQPTDMGQCRGFVRATKKA